MRALNRLALVVPLLAMALGCGGKTDGVSGGHDGGPGGDDQSESGSPSETGSPPAEGGLGDDGPSGPTPTANKVDLLFMIDNSASMGDKQALVAAAVPDILQGLVSLKVHDMHIGIVTSSLGGRGGDQCSPAATNPANPALNAHNDDRGELINRGGVAGDPTIENTPATGIERQPLPLLVPERGGQPGRDRRPCRRPSPTSRPLVTRLHDDGRGGPRARLRLRGAERGLVPLPRPARSVRPDRAERDQRRPTRAWTRCILQQRHDFLRPDSLLLVIVVTDENEEAADPLAIGGQGWALDNQNVPRLAHRRGARGHDRVPASSTRTTPRPPAPTIPTAPRARSCSNHPNFAARCPNDGAERLRHGYLDLDRRPAQRALLPPEGALRPRRRVPDVAATSAACRRPPSPTRPTSTTATATTSATRTPTPTASTHLRREPADEPDQELCKLPAGRERRTSCYYAAIAGVPHQLLQQDPTNPDSPQKDTLTDADWRLIMGNDPEHYDFRGADFHMIEDWNPRTTQGVHANASELSARRGRRLRSHQRARVEHEQGRPRSSRASSISARSTAGVGKDCTDPKYTGRVRLRDGRARLQLASSATRRRRRCRSTERRTRRCAR